MGIVAGDTMPDGTRLPDRHLIVATATTGEIRGLEWGGEGADEPGAKSWNDGQANTRALQASQHDHPAAQACAQVEIDGHRDWYLPALGELKLCFVNGREHFDLDAWYWSSTQYSRDGACTQDFDDGGTNASLKSWSGGVVRLVRSIPLSA
jgi:hypothetical protein